MTSKVPNKNQGVLFPIRVLVLSIRYPTMLVASPSAAWPERSAREASSGPNSTVYEIKYSKYMNQTVAHISLYTWPIA